MVPGKLYHNNRISQGEFHNSAGIKSVKEPKACIYEIMVTSHTSCVTHQGQPDTAEV